MAKYWAGLFCLLGHMFPCMFHFKGGKGILSGGTIAIMIDWRVALVVWGGFLILAILTRVRVPGLRRGPEPAFPCATWFVYQDLDHRPRAGACSCGGLVLLHAPGQHPAVC